MEFGELSIRRYRSVKRLLRSLVSYRRSSCCGTTVSMKIPSHDFTTPLLHHTSLSFLHRIVRALGSKINSATMQSVPTMLIAAAAQGAPIADDKAPMSMPPRSNST